MHLTARKQRILFYVLEIIVLGFLVLTAFVLIFPNSLLDREFSEEVQEHQNPLLDGSMKLISWFGYMPYSVIMVLLTALVFYLFKYKREAIFVVLTLTSGLISSIVKLLINRPRPSESLVRVVMKNQQASFPSGHVLFYVMFFGFLTLLMYQLKNISKTVRISIGVICLVLIFTIPFSRIYLGAHWFTDVTAGFFLGVVCLTVLSFFYLEQ